MRRHATLRSTTMIAALGMAALVTSSVDADAISRYKSKSMTCSAIKTIVRNQGAAIFEWTSSRTGNPNYRRIVRNPSYCNINQTTTLTAIPASNTSRCNVPYCVNQKYLDPFD